MRLPVFSGNRLTNDKLEPLDLPGAGRDPAAKRKMVPFTVALERSAVRDHGVAFCDHIRHRVGYDSHGMKLEPTPRDLQDRFEVANLARARVRLQSAEHRP